MKILLKIISFKNKLKIFSIKFVTEIIFEIVTGETEPTSLQQSEDKNQNERNEPKPTPTRSQKPGTSKNRSTRSSSKTIENSATNDNEDEDKDQDEDIDTENGDNNDNSSGKRRKIKTESEYVRKSKEDDDEIAKFMKLKCDHCLEEFITFAEVRRHYRLNHDMKGYIVCCNKKLFKRVLVLDHVRKHLNPEYFKCYECNKTFADNKCLQSHMIRTHESEDNKTFKCDQCPKTFSKQYTLNYHKRTHASPDQIDFYCELCKKTFATKNSFQYHRRSVHENVYGQMCHVCAKVIRDKVLFEKHVLNHAGVVEPKVQCEECGAWLKHAYGLREHMKRRHVEASDQHICNVCGKIAPTKRALRSHFKNVHSLERTFKCDVCSKAFKKALNLKEHMTTHTGEVLYTCPHCPKTFNSGANMHSHRKKAHRKEWEEGRRQRFGNFSNS